MSKMQQAFEAMNDMEKAAFWDAFQKLMKWRLPTGIIRSAAFVDQASTFVALAEQLFLRHGLEFEQYT